MIDLQQLLLSRDARQMRQEALLKGHPGKVLVCLTVILPGNVKRSDVSLGVARAAVRAIREGLCPVWEECLDLETGYEGYFLVDGTVPGVKLACCRIEGTHPLGRLMDIDVIELRGGRPSPVSRETVGEPERPCLICGRPARECMRAKTHTLEQLLGRIQEIYDSGGPC